MTRNALVPGSTAELKERFSLEIHGLALMADRHHPLARTRGSHCSQAVQQLNLFAAADWWVGSAERHEDWGGTERCMRL